MRTFFYRSIDTKGKEVIGTVQAQSMDRAVNHILNLDFVPVDAVPNEESSTGIRPMLKRLLGRRIDRRRLILITRQLADMLSAGFPLPLSISLLSDREGPGRLKSLLDSLAGDVRNGASFSDVLERHPHLFPSFHVAAIRSAERQGLLADGLAALADFAEREEDLRKQTR